MFQFAGSLPCVMDWRMDIGGVPNRFPHSEIPGSVGICPSPELIAAYHVFHRLLVPRHPPCALTSLANGSQAPLRLPAQPIALGCLARLLQSSLYGMTPLPCCHQ